MNALTFSPEQYSFDGSMYSANDTLELKLAQHGPERYVRDAQERLADDPAYKQLAIMSEVVDDGYSARHQIGQAFLSGGTVGLDLVWHYDRSLMRFIDHHITGLFDRLQDEHFRIGTTDEIFSGKRSKFIEATMNYGKDGYQEYGAPYANLLKPIIDKNFRSPEQMNAVRQGLGLVLEQAMIARQSDVDGLRKTVERFDDEGANWPQMAGRWVHEILRRQDNPSL